VTEHSPPGFPEPNESRSNRRFVPLFGDGLRLEGGGRLDSVDVAYEEWGTLNSEGTNAVLVLHALTGDSHAAGQAGPGHPTGGWWNGLLGPGAAIDTDRFFVVCPNVLGGCGGTTGPASLAPDGKAYGSRFPAITIRDQVMAEAALADHLGIDQWAAVIGGSMGGMRALEWCVVHRHRVDRALVLAVGATASAEQIALSSLQVRAIRADPAFQGGDYYHTGFQPTEGMAIARGIGQVSYRTPDELEARFGHSWQDEDSPIEGGRYAVESYLLHHGDKLAARFDPNSYVVLSQAMNHHDIGRGRNGIASALQQVTAEVTVAGIATDRLYPIESQHEIVRLLARGTGVRVIDSRAGHDGFLIEVDAVGTILKEILS
jgi:homoserine O-acetyltransferase/O-succinyltransferase